MGTHRSTGTLRPCLEELWTGWLCQGIGKQVDGRRGLETLAEMVGGPQGPHLSGFPPDTPGIVVPAAPSRFMVEVALGGQRKWQGMVILTWGYTSPSSGNGPLGRSQEFSVEPLKSQSWLLGFLCSCFEHILTYFDLRAGQAWRAAPVTGKLKIPQQL